MTSSQISLLYRLLLLIVELQLFTIKNLCGNPTLLLKKAERLKYVAAVYIKNDE